MDIILKRHVIAYIDLLGTKEKIKNDSDGLVLKILYNLYFQATKAFTKDIREEQIKMKIFSDNIIIAREIPSERNSCSLLLNQMIGIAACFQFLLLGGRWPSRGGLTIGDLYLDNTFVWGSGLVRAYELESKVAIFPRIVIDPAIIPFLTVGRKQISAKPFNHWLCGDLSFQKMLYGVFYFKIPLSFLFSSFGW